MFQKKYLTSSCRNALEREHSDPHLLGLSAGPSGPQWRIHHTARWEAGQGEKLQALASQTRAATWHRQLPLQEGNLRASKTAACAVLSAGRTGWGPAWSLRASEEVTGPGASE